jgi:large subunit ribosomal protein L28
MSKVCSITGKRPRCGHRISHSNVKTKRRFLPNLQKRRIWLPSEKRFVNIKITTKALRIIDKVGIEAALAKQSV